MTEEGVEVVSTDYYRTLQSGYSELLGLQGEDDRMPQLSEGQLKSRKAFSIPFNIRRFNEVNSSLGSDAAAKGFIEFPIKGYMNTEVWANSLLDSSCNFAAKVDGALYPNLGDGRYDWLVSGLRGVYQKDFHLTNQVADSMTMNQAYGDYGDGVISEQFSQHYDGVDLTP